jgi:type IV pilus assembly protein PilP
MRYLLSLCIFVIISGCAPEISDLRAYTESVKSRVQPSIEPYTKFEAQPPFAYSASSLRSPFEQPKGAPETVSQTRVENCMQPDFKRPKETLESYGLDALALTGSFTVQGEKWAIIKSNDGLLHKAKTKGRIGLFYGSITQIGTESITIEQLLPDGAGCWQRKTTTMTTASQAGE